MLHKLSQTYYKLTRVKMSFLLPVDPAGVNSTEGNTDLLSVAQHAQFQRLSGAFVHSTLSTEANGTGVALTIRLKWLGLTEVMCTRLAHYAYCLIITDYTVPTAAFPPSASPVDCHCFRRV